MNNENLTPCPLERTVGRQDGETTLGVQGFGSSPPLSGATQRYAPDLLGSCGANTIMVYLFSFFVKVWSDLPRLHQLYLGQLVQFLLVQRQRRQT